MKTGLNYQRDDGINLHFSACIEQRAPSVIAAAFRNGGGQKKLINNSRKISGIQFLQINTRLPTSHRSLILSGETTGGTWRLASPDAKN